jgi:hypothetical protein
LHGWFNRQAPRCLRSLGLFDPEGLFIGDASYLLVPDNQRYEQSDDALRELPGPFIALNILPGRAFLPA